MLLVLDVGNTNTVIGLYDDDKLIQHWRVQTHRQRATDEHGIVLRQLFNISGVDHERIQHAIVSCVVPPITRRYDAMLRRYVGVEPLIVGPGIRTGMRILYENPREVGADRIVNSVAAYELHGAGLIVVDFGTATTFDAVNPQGEYLGGVIAPGMTISADALFNRAAMLPRVNIKRPDQVVGRNTVASMQSGLYYGYAGLVGEVVRRMKGELQFPVKVFATGGLAGLIAAECDVIDVVDRNLTLDGLRLLWLLNQ